LKYGTLQDIKYPDSQELLYTAEDKIDDIEQYFHENPYASIGKAAKELGIPKLSLHEILIHFWQLHPYKVTIHQLLMKRSKIQRMEFCKIICELDEKRMIFCDEAHFWLNGCVNKPNYWFWEKKNSNVALEKSFSQKVTVWVAISVKGIYLEFFESPITGDSYQQLLETKFFPYAKKNGLVKHFYFVQDGIMPHRTKKVFESIFNVYENRIIGLKYPNFDNSSAKRDLFIEWPSYSRDLNPCNFFLWEYLKNNCYAQQPETIKELIIAVRKVVNGISKEMLNEVFLNFRKRIRFCDKYEGAQGGFENLYH